MILHHTTLDTSAFLEPGAKRTVPASRIRTHLMFEFLSDAEFYFGRLKVSSANFSDTRGILVAKAKYLENATPF